MDVVRMTPLIIQLMFVSYLVPVSWDLLWVGTAVIGLHYATYMAESYIAGIASVDRGQWEAARALSLPLGRTWRAIVLPQALRQLEKRARRRLGLPVRGAHAGAGVAL